MFLLDIFHIELNLQLKSGQLCNLCNNDIQLLLLNIPASHGKHVYDISAETVPWGHFSNFEDADKENVPGGHFSQASPSGEYVPALHGIHPSTNLENA